MSKNMDNIKYDIENVAISERIRSMKNFPLFNSEHEGYAVILEEFDEAMADLENVISYKKALWDAIKCNDKNQAIVNTQRLYHAILQMSAEWVQVMAMCNKFEDSTKDQPEDQRERDNKGKAQAVANRRGTKWDHGTDQDYPQGE